MAYIRILFAHGPALDTCCLHMNKGFTGNDVYICFSIAFISLIEAFLFTDRRL